MNQVSETKKPNSQETSKISEYLEELAEHAILYKSNSSRLDIKRILLRDRSELTAQQLCFCINTLQATKPGNPQP